MKKVVVDKEKCLGCGLCVSIAEKAFKLSAEGKAEVLAVEEEEEAKVQEAIDSCAVGAIKWQK
ncbi:MAG TPA: ferredoxin [Patescibacteria group bacterium]|nr:ferredoxin [Patescibacteria group bacterium]